MKFLRIIILTFVALSQAKEFKVDDKIIQDIVKMKIVSDKILSV